MLQKSDFFGSRFKQFEKKRREEERDNHAKQFSSVLDMVKDSTEDKELVKSFEGLINSKQISKTLFALLCRANMSQGDIAKKMNCSQGKVSEVENAGDTDLTIHDLVQYCSAVNMWLEVGFSDARMTMANQVKYHCFRLKILLDKMREMAR